MLDYLRRKAFKETGDEDYLDSSLICVTLYKANQINSSLNYIPKQFVFDISKHIIPHTYTRSGKLIKSNHIKKATDDAKKKLIRVPLKEGRTLHHDMKGHYGAGRVVLRSAPAGTGIIAGGPMRAVFETLGVQDVVAKSVGTSNPHNMIKATFDALNFMNSPRNIANKRGKKVSEVFGNNKNTDED